MANEVEQSAAMLLLSTGADIKIGKRTFKVKEMCFGMLDEITALRLKMHIDEQAMKEDPIRAANTEVNSNLKYAARIVAIAILGPGKLKRKLLTGLVARYLMERIKSSELIVAARSVIQMTNVGDFLNSIRLLSGIRMTAPMDPSLIDANPPSAKEEPSAKSSAGPMTT